MRLRYTCSALAVLMASVALPAASFAAPAGVAELLRQAQFWMGKGRQDLADQAYRRVLAIDPGNADAQRGLSHAGSVPLKPEAPVRAAPSPAPAARSQPARTPAKQTAEPARPRTPADQGGDARAAGFKALDAGDDNRAITLFTQALKHNANDHDAQGGIGVARLRQGRFAEARDYLTRASRGGDGQKWASALRSASFYADLRAAEKARDDGNLSKAEELARKLAASDNKDAVQAKALLGDILSREGRFAEAQEAYRQAAGSLSGDRAGQANLAQMQASAARAQAMQLLGAGDSIGAERAYQAALAAGGDDPWLRYDYARLLAAQGRNPAAESVMAPLRNARAPDAIYAAALYYQQQGQNRLAQQLIDRIPASDRDQPMRDFAIQLKSGAAIEQAKLLQKNGRTMEAVNGLREVARNPGLPVTSLGQVASALFDMGDIGTAMSIAQQAASMPATGAPESYDPIVRVLAKGGQDALAAELVQKISANSGTGGAGLQAIGDLNATLAATQADRLRTSGNLAPAFDVLQGAWASAPNNVELLSALARLYQSGSMYPQSVQVYEMVLRQKPDDVGALIGLADAAGAGQDFNRARGAIAVALQREPANPEVYMAAARLEQQRGNESNALKYLKQARALYDQRTAAIGAGGFPMGNPFGANPFASSNPFGGQQTAGGYTQPVNPFALGRGASKLPSGVPYMPGAAPMAGYAGAAAYPASGYAGGTPYSPSAYPAASLPAAIPVQGQGFQPWSGQAQGAAPVFSAAPASVSSPFASTSGYGQQPVAQGDPVLNQINQQIAELSGNVGSRAEVTTGFRQRTGEKGLSQLDEIHGTASFSTGFAGGQASVRIEPVVVDAGTPTTVGLARYGMNPIIQGAGVAAESAVIPLVHADAQHEAGAGLTAAYDSKFVKADIGSTPLGFESVRLQGGLSWSPRPTPNTQAKIWGERRPVTDSVTSYAGSLDPVSGLRWGEVMKTGGGASLSYDRKGSGVYVDGSVYDIDGTEVPGNRSIQVNVGGYMKAYETPNSTLTTGINLNYQSYSNNQNFFSFGHGGYFSPQSFVSIGFPVNYQGEFERWKMKLSVSPGYQTYDQDGAQVFPTQTDLQLQLEALAGANANVLARYDSVSKSGFGIAAGAGATYRLENGMNLGGDVQLNTFGGYNEFQMMLKLVQPLGGGGQ